MAKKSSKPTDPEKVVIYIEVAPWIKQAMEDIATEHERSLTGEATVAFKQYIEAHKNEEGGAR